MRNRSLVRMFGLIGATAILAFTFTGCKNSSANAANTQAINDGTAQTNGDADPADGNLAPAPNGAPASNTQVLGANASYTPQQQGEAYQQQQPQNYQEQAPPPLFRAITTRISPPNTRVKTPSPNTPTSPHPHSPSTISRPPLKIITSGLPATGPGALAATIGSPAYGARPPTTALFGRPRTGATMAAAMASTTATGVPTSAITVVSTTAMATSALATSAAIGIAIASTTTAA